MRKMPFVSQGANGEDRRATHLVDLVGSDVVAVGEVGEVAYAVAEDGEILVEAADGGDREASGRERFESGEIVKVGFGEAGELMRGEDIVIVVLDSIEGGLIAEELHFLVLDVVERADVVETPHMIAMSMSDEDGIEMRDVMSEHLLTEVGSDVEEYVAVLVGDEESGSAQTFVVRVGGAAYSAVTSDNGYPLRGTRTKENNLHRK